MCIRVHACLVQGVAAFRRLFFFFVFFVCVCVCLCVCVCVCVRACVLQSAAVTAIHLISGQSPQSSMEIAGRDIPVSSDDEL